MAAVTIFLYFEYKITGIPIKILKNMSITWSYLKHLSMKTLKI